uniref:Uncharacterized protein n=1 Tax=Sphaerodactylus townsendi TaxID=933632 RepID=A0ACB8FWF2_9SAUR
MIQGPFAKSSQFSRNRATERIWAKAVQKSSKIYFGQEPKEMVHNITNPSLDRFQRFQSELPPSPLQFDSCCGLHLSKNDEAAALRHRERTERKRNPEPSCLKDSHGVPQCSYSNSTILLLFWVHR